MQNEKTDHEWSASHLTDKISEAEQEMQQIEARSAELLKLLQTTADQNLGMELEPQAMRPPSTLGSCAGTQLEDMGVGES